MAFIRIDKDDMEDISEDFADSQYIENKLFSFNEFSSMKSPIENDCYFYSEKEKPSSVKNQQGFPTSYSTFIEKKDLNQIAEEDNAFMNFFQPSSKGEDRFGFKEEISAERDSNPPEGLLADQQVLTPLEVLNKKTFENKIDLSPNEEPEQFLGKKQEKKKGRNKLNERTFIEGGLTEAQIRSDIMRRRVLGCIFPKSLEEYFKKLNKIINGNTSDINPFHFNFASFKYISSRNNAKNYPEYKEEEYCLKYFLSAEDQKKFDAFLERLKEFNRDLASKLGNYCLIKLIDIYFKDDISEYFKDDISLDFKDAIFPKISDLKASSNKEERIKASIKKEERDILEKKSKAYRKAFKEKVIIPFENYFKNYLETNYRKGK